ncbi:hypothetical protein GJ496_001039 [Pomphorhynchus laevis]|nr:hypothetical protein GJ496_001039 [Pomphorhynchus laevis]
MATVIHNLFSTDSRYATICRFIFNKILSIEQVSISKYKDQSESDVQLRRNRAVHLVTEILWYYNGRHCRELTDFYNQILIHSISSLSTQNRACAFKCLGCLCSLSKPLGLRSLPLLISALQLDDDYVRDNALSASLDVIMVCDLSMNFFPLSKAMNEIHSVILGLLSDENTNIRTNAVKGICKLMQLKLLCYTNTLHLLILFWFQIKNCAILSECRLYLRMFFVSIKRYGGKCFYDVMIMCLMSLYAANPGLNPKFAVHILDFITSISNAENYQDKRTQLICRIIDQSQINETLRNCLNVILPTINNLDRGSISDATFSKLVEFATHPNENISPAVQHRLKGIVNKFINDTDEDTADSTD